MALVHTGSEGKIQNKYNYTKTYNLIVIYKKHNECKISKGLKTRTFRAGKRIKNKRKDTSAARGHNKMAMMIIAMITIPEMIVEDLEGAQGGN